MAELPRGTQARLRMATIDAVAKPGAPARMLLRSNVLSGVIRADKIEAELRRDPALPLAIVVDQTRWRVGDFDNPETVAAALAWAEGERAQGRTVIVRPSGEEGHWHIWVEVDGPEDGRIVGDVLKALGADVRDKIRDPFGPHRIHGWVDAAEGRTLADEAAGFLPAPVGVDHKPSAPRAQRDSAGHDCDRYASRSEGLAALTLAAANVHRGEQDAAWQTVATAGCRCARKLAERDRGGDGGRRWWSRSVWPSAARKAEDQPARRQQAATLTSSEEAVLGSLWAAARTAADCRRVLVLALLLAHRDDHGVATVPVRVEWLRGLGSFATIAGDLRALTAAGVTERVGVRDDLSSEAAAYRLSHQLHRVPTGGVGHRVQLVGRAVFALVKGCELTPLVDGGGLGFAAARVLVGLWVAGVEGGAALSTVELIELTGMSRSAGYRAVGRLVEVGLVVGGHGGWRIVGSLAAAVDAGEAGRVLEPLVSDRLRWLVACRDLRAVIDRMDHRGWLRRCLAAREGRLVPVAA